MTTNHDIVTAIRNCRKALDDAEALCDILTEALQDNPDNFAIEQALEKADALCEELEGDLYEFMDMAEAREISVVEYAN